MRFISPGSPARRAGQPAWPWLAQPQTRPCFESVTFLFPQNRLQAPALQPSVHLSDWAPLSKQQTISTFNTTRAPEHPDPRETPFLERPTDSGSFGGKAWRERSQTVCPWERDTQSLAPWRAVSPTKAANRCFSFASDDPAPTNGPPSSRARGHIVSLGKASTGEEAAR